MDSKYRLNKSEMIRITELLDGFILQDPNINLFAIKTKMKDELVKRLQEDFEKVMEITPEIKAWLDARTLDDISNIYYRDKSYSYKHKYDNTAFHIDTNYMHGECVNTITIKSYTYELGSAYTYNYFQNVLDIFESVYDKYYKEFNDKYKLYLKTKKELCIVLNSLKTAQNVLDKFGFIENINKYINTLLSEQAKPISCMTQAVENSVDNYLNQRKALDEDKK